MMINRAIPSAAALALFTAVAGAADMTPMVTKAPPQAPPSVTGYVELYTGWAKSKDAFTFCDIGGSCDSFGDKFDGWVLGGAGRVNYWWAANASLQLDAQAEGTSYRFTDPGFGSGHFSTQGYLVGGHASWRDPQRGLFGVFVGAGDVSSGGIVGGGDMRHGVVGLEGQLYLNSMTLYGQAGYDTTIGNIFPGLDGLHAWFVRGTARFYVNPNFRLEGTVLYASGGYDFTSVFGPPPSSDMETWLWRAKAEYKFASSPFSVFVTYQGSQTTFDLSTPTATESLRLTDQRVMGGVRLYIGEKTLQWNDTMGTTLDIIDPLGVPSAIFTGGGGMSASDARLKRDIVLVARLDNGLGLYRYRYLWSDVVYVGVMAQEVAYLYPASVVQGSDGYLRVDYGSLGLKLLTWEQWQTLAHATGVPMSAQLNSPVNSLGGSL
jgi:hypothetical protein